MVQFPEPDNFLEEVPDEAGSPEGVGKFGADTVADVGRIVVVEDIGWERA